MCNQLWWFCSLIFIHLNTHAVDIQSMHNDGAQKHRVGYNICPNSDLLSVSFPPQNQHEYIEDDRPNITRPQCVRWACNGPSSRVEVTSMHEILADCSTTPYAPSRKTLIRMARFHAGCTVGWPLYKVLTKN